jgi:hypothetical protein
MSAKPDETPEPGTPGKPQLPPSLEIHRRLGHRVFVAGFVVGTVIWVTAKTGFLGSFLLFFLPIVAGLGGSLAYFALVRARCPDPSCGDRMDFSGGLAHGTYRCRRCGREDTFHHEAAEDGRGRGD